MIVSTRVRSLSNVRTSDGAPTASRSAATTRRRSGSPSPSTAATVKQSPHVATTEGIKSQDVQDLVITAVENRFGRINMLSEPIEWLTDNGSCFVAKDTASLLRDIGMEPCTTPVRSPQSNGMAEAFVKTFKRDYVSVNPPPDAETVMAQLPFWFEHYNNLHPHSALGYQSPREFISSQSQT